MTKLSLSNGLLVFSVLVCVASPTMPILGLCFLLVLNSVSKRTAAYFRDEQAAKVTKTSTELEARLAKIEKEQSQLMLTNNMKQLGR